jgi:tellurite resistance protein TerC
MQVLIWTLFILLIMGFLALDLGVFNRKDHVIGFRESLRWTALWITVSLAFDVVIYFLYEHHIGGFGLQTGETLSGLDASMLFLTGYVVEYSLSVDNIFVIALIIGTFRVPRQFQHRVLFWGILGALVLRGVMIGAGAVLLNRFAWMMYVFGGILLITALKMAFQKDDHFDIQNSKVLRFARKLYPVTADFEGHKFLTRLPDGRRAMTPLMLVLLMIETTDVVFAVDSIPAVFAITSDPFLVFTSNVFAILGLRSLYFALAGLIVLFRYLKASLVVLLAFIGVKMLITEWVHIPPAVSLGVIGLILGVGILASVLTRPPTPPAAEPAP